MNVSLDTRIEWLEAPGVTTPELAATWARYEIWVGNRCVTQVEANDGNFRRGVYGSLYPLAYWVASNWWVLTSHIRPTEVETRYWTWRNVDRYPWLAQHNLRGASDGMPWPDLTIVTEGAVSHIVWAQDQHKNENFTPVRFATSGYDLVRTEDMRAGLAAIVNDVLERLAEEGLPKTQLAEEWTSIARAHDDERNFCRTTARMGLDPYSLSDQTSAEVISVADSLPDEIADDFFDSADVEALTAAVSWIRRASPVADRATMKAKVLQPLHSAIQGSLDSHADEQDIEPWAIGYNMARNIRHSLNLKETDQFDISPWVGLGDVNVPSNGLQGFVAIRNHRCGLVLDNQRVGAPANRFGQARALGRVLIRPQQKQFILSAARGREERIAGAFAAELLAPAEGIRQMLDVIGSHSDNALDAIARRYKVSSLLVRYQYDNQIATASHTSIW